MMAERCEWGDKIKVTFDLIYSEAVSLKGKWVITADNFPYTITNVVELPQHDEGQLVILGTINPAPSFGTFRFYIDKESLLVSCNDVWIYSYRKGVLHKSLEC